MSASRASMLFAAALLALSAPEALSQTSGPRLLLPGPGGESSQPEEERREPAPVLPDDGTGIRIDQLPAPGEAAAGLLGAAGGGLPASLWQGSDRRVVEALYRRMPPAYRSGAARQLARQLLLSAGAPPVGPGDDAELLGARLGHLLSMGEVDAVVGLVEAAAASESNKPVVAEPYAEALFLGGQTDRACGIVQSQLQLGGRGFWQRASVFCDLRAGRRADAELTRSILRDTGGSGQAFDSLASALADETNVAVADATAFSPLLAAMFAAASSARLENTGEPVPAVAGALATMPRLNAVQRIAAGEHAIRYGALEPSVVMLIYGSQDGELSESPYREPLATAMQAEENLARAEAILAAWRSAAEAGPGERQLVARFSHGIVEHLGPSSELEFLAPAAVRINLLTGDVAAGRAWLDLLQRQAAPSDPGTADSRHALVALVQVAGLEPPNGQRLQLWARTLAEAPDAPARLLRVLMLLDALGRPLDDGVWSEQLAEQALPDAAVRDPALWRQLVMAAGAGRIGETVQASLALLGEAVPAELDPVTLATVVGSLRRVGLEQPARQLAIEAVIGAGD